MAGQAARPLQARQLKPLLNLGKIRATTGWVLVTEGEKPAMQQPNISHTRLHHMVWRLQGHAEN